MIDYLEDDYRSWATREQAEDDAQWESYFHARGDDRADELLAHLELFALGASLPSSRNLASTRGETHNTRRDATTGHIPSPLPVAPPSSPPGGGARRATPRRGRVKRVRIIDLLWGERRRDEDEPRG